MQTENTTILSQNIRLNLDETSLNNNVLVIGDTGSGKTIGFVHSNLMQANTNYIVTDFRGNLYETHADSLREKGFNVMLVDFENMIGSYYNPLHYINKNNFEIMEKEIVEFVNIIFGNINNENNSDNDTDVRQAERTIFTTLLLYCIMKHGETVSFKDVIDLFNTIVNDDISGVTRLINEIKKVHPNCNIINEADLNPNHFQHAMILISFRLTPFSMYYKRELHTDVHKNNPWRKHNDELNLETFGDNANVVFVTAPTYNITMMPLVSLFIWQTSQILTKVKNKRIIRFMLDDFQNLGYTPFLGLYLSTATMHNVSYNLMIQSLVQLKELYPNEWEQIIAACNSMLVCGCCQTDDVCYISQLTGKIVISDPPIRSHSMKQKSNFIQKLFSKLKSEPKTVLRTVSNVRPEEIRRMDQNHCLVLQKGCDAKLDDKCQDGWILLQKIYEEKRKKKE